MTINNNAITEALRPGCLHQDFFAQWQDAAPNLPVLIAAKKEYQKMK